MKKYWIDFSGYLCVEAENEDEAERLFWAEFVKDVKEPFFDDVWDIDGIEERPEGDPLAVVYGDTFKAPTAQEIEDFWNEK